MVNGKDVGFAKAKKNSSLLPLNTERNAPDGGVISVPLKTDVSKEYEIKFYL